MLITKSRKRRIRINPYIILALLVSFITIFILISQPKSSDSPSPETPEPTTAATPVETPLESTIETPTPTPEVAATTCPTTLGNLMLINPNFTVSESWIAARTDDLVDITELYGIKEGNAYNGIPRLTPEAAEHLNTMLTAYTTETGGTMTTRSCFRAQGTSCGRLCYATGTSDHHTGLTCDLVDDQYGDTLDTDNLDNHPDWQWLKANSYKYGFIDRFPNEWAGGPMTEPINVDENGTTGLYETWHYRYVGIDAATDIATGKYNNGKYDSLEHYLKARSFILNLLGPASC